MMPRCALWETNPKARMLKAKTKIWNVSKRLRLLSKNIVCVDFEYRHVSTDFERPLELDRLRHVRKDQLVHRTAGRIRQEKDGGRARLISRHEDWWNAACNTTHCAGAMGLSESGLHDAQEALGVSDFADKRYVSHGRDTGSRVLLVRVAYCFSFDQLEDRASLTPYEMPGDLNALAGKRTSPLRRTELESRNKQERTRP